VFPRLPTLVELAEIGPVDQLQLVQRVDGALDAIAAVGATPTTPVADAIVDRIRAALDVDVPVELTWAESPLPRTRGGKFERFRREG
jgi:hypothetical protein